MRKTGQETSHPDVSSTTIRHLVVKAVPDQRLARQKGILGPCAMILLPVVPQHVGAELVPVHIPIRGSICLGGEEVAACNPHSTCSRCEEAGGLNERRGSGESLPY